MMTRKEFIGRFVKVHKCAGCGGILDYGHSHTAFCDPCRLGWNAALNVGCGSCFAPARECTCIPQRMKKAGAVIHRKLFFYQKESAERPEISILYVMKKKKYKRLTGFCADQLLPLVREELDVLGVDSSSVLVTNVPRSKRTLRLRGFDQSALLAEAIAVRIGARYERLFSSRLFSKTQKKLNAKGRERNAAHGIYLDSKAELDGYHVILIDDIVSSGASMSACIKILNSKGAGCVMCFSLASKNSV